MKLWLAGGAAVAAVATTLWWQSTAVVVATSTTPLSQPQRHAAAVNELVGLLPTKVQQLATFRGAQVDGALRTDHKGSLMIDMQLRHWLDFYLSAQGEVPLADLILTMQQQMRQLPEPGQSQALALLDNYLGYLAELANYDAEAGRRLVHANASDLAARLAWQQRLRRQWLEPAVVEAFFVAEEKIDEYTLAAQQLKRDGATAEQLAALEQTLPEEIQQMRQESRQLLTLVSSETELKQQGASAADIQQWRVERYGSEAAARLAKVDQQQAQWHERLRAYQLYQNSSALSQLSNDDRNKLLMAYRNKHFSANEQKRLQAAMQLLANES